MLIQCKLRMLQPGRGSRHRALAQAEAVLPGRAAKVVVLGFGALAAIGKPGTFSRPVPREVLSSDANPPRQMPARCSCSRTQACCCGAHRSRAKPRPDQGVQPAYHQALRLSSSGPLGDTPRAQQPSSSQEGQILGAGVPSFCACCSIAPSQPGPSSLMGVRQRPGSAPTRGAADWDGRQLPVPRPIPYAAGTIVGEAPNSRPRRRSGQTRWGVVNSPGGKPAPLQRDAMTAGSSSTAGAGKGSRPWPWSPNHGLPAAANRSADQRRNASKPAQPPPQSDKTAIHRPTS